MPETSSPYPLRVILRGGRSVHAVRALEGDGHETACDRRLPDDATYTDWQRPDTPVSCGRCQLALNRLARQLEKQRPEIMEKQVWANCDPRRRGHHFRITAVGATHAVVEPVQFDPKQGVLPASPGSGIHPARVRLDRLQSRGRYRLVQQADGTPVQKRGGR